jgi:hypothetical protein
MVEKCRDCLVGLLDPVSADEMKSRIWPAAWLAVLCAPMYELVSCDHVGAWFSAFLCFLCCKEGESLGQKMTLTCASG